MRRYTRKSRIDVRRSGVQTHYLLDDDEYVVLDVGSQKIVTGPSYHSSFNKNTGFFQRFGSETDGAEGDPFFCPIGPELLDIEVVVNGCPNNCPWCSPAGVMVDIPQGQISIENIKQGMVVLGHNGNTIYPQIVQEVYQRDYEGDLIEIETEDGRILKLTPEHEVFLKDGSRIKAGELTADMELLDIG